VSGSTVNALALSSIVHRDIRTCQPPDLGLSA